MLKEDLEKYKDYNPLFQDLLDLTFLTGNYIVYKNTIITILDNNLIDLSIKSDKDFILYNLEDILTNFYDDDLKDYIIKNLKNNLEDYLSRKIEIKDLDTNLDFS